jgi:preprotein translocase subunit SecF
MQPKINIIKNTKTWFTFSAVLVIASILSMIVFGFNLSSDFVEGNLYELQMQEEVTPQDLTATLQNFEEVEVGGIDAKRTSAGTMIVRMKRLGEEESESVLDLIKEKYGEIEVIQNRSVSPVFAQTFKKRALTALLFALGAIIIYIAFAFRKVSRGISSWKLGISAIVALAHDVIITIGIFTVLGRFAGVEFDALFITALLTIMGFSVHDTIVVFDRVRENLVNKAHQETLADTAEKSLHQTMARSINTSISTLIVLLALLFLGSPSIFWFVFALVIGIIVGTYSSIFIASPLLVLWQKKK